ncbi:Crp/Fnr family transcriptional regulator [Nocardiopsis sp. EMB25]|uniref:Crp/Fnr family transcriptional regulator n=1 Tax=Nocardiopsis TaxID=2013 RepID=UPI0003477B93|nr:MULTISPECIES: Crp/Fnr family transcriptional regulator [Nocardiopsis]MCY9785950.1 Crp/Fnr family transcriptional regulator [Nocardiopsis sp. EMB25]
MNPRATSAVPERRLNGTETADPRVQQAAWVARCVGRGSAAPLTPRDLNALATFLHRQSLSRGAVAFREGDSPSRVWIVRSGHVELSVGSGEERTVVEIRHAGDVDGDIQFLLGKPLPYTARATDDVELLYMRAEDFERLMSEHRALARRWLASIAGRLDASQGRIMELLGKSLTEQTARLLLDEASSSVVPLPQRTLAAMLGVRRPSLNRVLKRLEREELIEMRYAAIEILDPDGLSRKAHGSHAG